jgi:hypothetical protein
MGFWDTLNELTTSGRQRQRDLADRENALRVRALERAEGEELNLLRQRDYAREAIAPAAEPYYPEFIVKDQQKKALDLADPEAAIARRQAEFYPTEKAPIAVAPNAALVDPVTRKELYRNTGEPETPDLAREFKRTFGTDVPTGYAPVVVGGKLTGDVRPLKGMKGPEEPKRDAFADEAKLRGEFSDRTKTFEVVRDSYSKIREVAEKPSPAGDISLIFGYMKMLDPNSTVRESEYATAQNAGSIPERVRALFNKAKTGEGLTPSQRRDFLNQASKIYGSQLKTYKQDEERYGGLAKTYGSDPSRVIYDRSGGLVPVAPAIPTVGTIEDG